MENSPFSSITPVTESGPKSPDDDKDKNKKSSKKSKALGSFIVERPTEEAAKDAAPEGLLDTLFDKPETAAEVDSTETHEDGEAAEMSQEDADYAVQEIATERRSEIAEEPVAVTPEDQAAHEAAQEFYDKIVDEGLDPEEAASETLADIAPEAEPELNAETEVLAEDEDQIMTPPPASPPPPTGPPHGPAGGPPTPPPTPRSVGALAPATPNIQNVYYYDRSRAFSDMMIGGVVGYLIARRRGRIKTERKLLPVQKKLERQVRSLKEDLATKEFTIREAAKQRVRAEAAPRPKETVIMDRRERPLPAPELHRKPNLAPPERIGKVMIAAETAAVLIPERRPETAETAPRLSLDSAERQVEMLTRNELLTLSEKVIVEGSTLRNVYETNLISERGLRRLLTEYLRGGDVIRAFKRELIEREIDFERDPKLRDTVRKNLTGGGRSQSLQKLLAQAGVAPVDETPAQIAAARAEQLAEAKRQSKKASNRKLIDVSLITVIAVLLAVVIILAVNKM